jgi:hypothetical protein
MEMSTGGTDDGCEEFGNSEGLRVAGMRTLSGHGGLLLYLDFDGVLHHEDVWWHDLVGAYLRAPDEFKLFQHVGLLEQLLAPYPELRIVLSTSWVRRNGCAGAAKNLGPRLRQRVIGATFQSRMNDATFAAIPRGQQVWADVQRRQPRDWIALDDCPDGWPAQSQGKFIQAHRHHGISEPAVLAAVRQRLSEMCGGTK